MERTATKRKFKTVFRDFNKQFSSNDHIYTLPPGGEIRERLYLALERVASLEKEVKSLEQSKKRLSQVTTFDSILKVFQFKQL